jgi:hypothetical protein
MRLVQFALLVLAAGFIVSEVQRTSPQTAAAQAAPPGAQHMLISSSATNMQSFLWILDEGTGDVTFCMSTSDSPMSSQYDFGCKKHHQPKQVD